MTLNTGPGARKVKKPYWCNLEENISFILVETGSFGKAEALLSFWGEPFMARMSGTNVPRYVLYVRESSELIKSLKGIVPEIYTAGDCAEPRLIIDAIADGSRVGRAI